MGFHRTESAKRSSRVVLRPKPPPLTTYTTHVLKMKMVFQFTIALIAIVLSLQATTASASADDERPKLTFKADGTFKMLHLSDVHYRIGPDEPCRDITAAEEPYCQNGSRNTTDFIARLIVRYIYIYTHTHTRMSQALYLPLPLLLLLTTPNRCSHAPGAGEA